MIYDNDKKEITFCRKIFETYKKDELIKYRTAQIKLIFR